MSSANLPIYSGGVPLPKHSYQWEPAGTTAIRPLLAKLSLACRTGQADDVDRRAQAALYIENLADLPLRFLAEAVDEWIKTQTFWPSIAELRALASNKRANEDRRRREQQWENDKRVIAERDAKMQRPSPEQMRELISSIGRVKRA